MRLSATFEVWSRNKEMKNLKLDWDDQFNIQNSKFKTTKDGSFD